MPTGQLKSSNWKRLHFQDHLRDPGYQILNVFFSHAWRFHKGKKRLVIYNCVLLKSQVCLRFYKSFILSPVAMVKASGTGGQFATKAKEEARSTGVMSRNHRRMVLCKLSAKRTGSLENRMFVSRNSAARVYSYQVRGLEPLWLLVCVRCLTENSQDKEQ